MNIKKISISIMGLACAACLLAACGNNSKYSDGVKENVKIDKDDAVKTEKKIVDGKEIEEYPMSDGTVVQVEEQDDDSSGSSDSTNDSSDTSNSTDND